MKKHNKNLMDFFKLDNIFKHRHDQVIKEETIDILLDELPCKDTLYSYFKFRREFNRYQYHIFQKTPFLDKFSLSKLHLHEIDVLDFKLNECLENTLISLPNQDKMNKNEKCTCIELLLKEHILKKT